MSEPMGFPDHEPECHCHAAVARYVEARAGALDVEALDVALVGMVRTSWPMDRNAEEKGWNEAIHAARKKVRAILAERELPEPVSLGYLRVGASATEPETLAQQLNHAISEAIATTPPRKKRKP